MRIVLPLSAFAALACSAGLHAQSVPDDQWTTPATSSTAGTPYRSQPLASEAGHGRFAFRDDRPRLPPTPLAPIPGQKAPLLGSPAWDGDGRPIMSCALEPHDPRCR